MICAVAVMLMLAAPGYAVTFSVRNYVYNSDSTTGDATTPNSYGTAYIYRRNISGQSGTTVYNTEYLPSNGTTLPGRYSRDTNSEWGTAPQVGDLVVGVTEVRQGLNGYTGLSYVAASYGSVTQDNLDNNFIRVPHSFLQPIPTPEARSITRDSIVISWPAIRIFDDRGNRINMVETYAVYRSEHPSGPFEWEADVPHKDGEMTYKDKGVSKGKTYFYKLKLRYSWPANRPPYYETAASSAASPGITVK